MIISAQIGRTDAAYVETRRAKLDVVLALEAIQ
jgi:hypothetical protein